MFGVASIGNGSSTRRKKSGLRFPTCVSLTSLVAMTAGQLFWATSRWQLMQALCTKEVSNSFIEGKIHIKGAKCKRIRKFPLLVAVIHAVRTTSRCCQSRMSP